MKKISSLFNLRLLFAYLLKYFTRANRANNIQEMNTSLKMDDEENNFLGASIGNGAF